MLLENIKKEIEKILTGIDRLEIKYSVMGKVSEDLGKLDLGDIKYFYLSNNVGLCGIVVHKDTDKVSVLLSNGAKVDGSNIRGYRPIKLERDVRERATKIKDAFGVYKEKVNGIGKLLLSKGLVGSVKDKTIYITGVVDGYSKSSLIVDGLPDGYNVHISDNAFKGMECLREVDLSRCINLKVIGDSSFHSCVNLSRVVLPKSLEYIKDSAFGVCGITDINLCDCVNLKEVRSYAFTCNPKLERVEFSGNLKYIVCGAFLGCDALRVIDLSRCTGYVTLMNSSLDTGVKLDVVKLSRNIDYIGEDLLKRTELRGVLDLSKSDIKNIHKDAFRGNFRVCATKKQLNKFSSLKGLGNRLIVIG